MFKIGCCGWPIRREEYFRRFSAVEVNSSFYNLPLLATVERWRAEAPEGFVFSMKAWQLITHPSSSPTYRRLTGKISPKRLAGCGHFRATDEVVSAWQRTAAAARAMGARFIVFQTPRSFYPQADHLRDMYRFFKGLPRGKIMYAWEPRGESWTKSAVDRVCADLDLVLAFDPLADAAGSSRREAAPFSARAEFARPGMKPAMYCRLHGNYERDRPVYTHQYADAELETLRGRLEGRSGCLFFNNATMWDDGCRFLKLIEADAARSSIGARRAGKG